LAEVLKHLLDNAVKFTPDGGPIGLEAHAGTAPNTVDLIVWDTGIGIAPDQHEHIFHAFTQADARLSRTHEGIGIGLAYVDQMVHLMGGTLALESTPGSGTRFTITLPA
jgi:signal transduction histidine kinase